MKLPRALALVLATAPIVPGVLVGSTVAAHSSEGCYPVGYGVKYSIVSKASAPVVTHALQVVVGPKTSYSETHTVRSAREVTAGITTEAGFKAEAGKIIAKAEVSAKVTLQAAGRSTKETSVSKTFNIDNSGKKTRVYVFYRGTVKWTGKFVKKTCNSSYQLVKEYGRWRSWTVESTGTPLCGTSPDSRVARRALSQNCG